MQRGKNSNVLKNIPMFLGIFRTEFRKETVSQKHLRNSAGYRHLLNKGLRLWVKDSCAVAKRSEQARERSEHAIV